MRTLLRLTGIISVLVVLVMLFASNARTQVAAQAVGDPWTAPVNISHSGSTNTPVVARDAEGTIHVIWQDKYAGAVYSRLEGGKWSQPVAMAFPFGESIPLLVSDSKGSIHTFWITTNESIAYTRMTGTAQGITWDATQTIAEAGLSLQAMVDSNGAIHVAYVRQKDAPNLPAGVYYRQSKDGGASWTPGKLIYASQYYRGMIKDDTNISIAAATDSQGTRVYIAWDNKARKKVFFSLSSDDGGSWSDPKEVQGMDTAGNSASPSGIEVGTFSNKVVLIWQTGDTVMGCRQLYQSSSDGGTSWSTPLAMPTDIYGCPQENHLFSSNNMILLMTSIQDGIYLLAWNGDQWSNPEFQHTLTGFNDPETQAMVLLGCQNSILLPEGQLFVVGCDQGNGGDIWATQRPVSDTNQWYPKASVWSVPVQLSDSSSEISAPAMVADTQGHFHVIWVQGEASGTTAVATTQKRVIYYSGYDGSKWSRPVIVLTSPGGDADHPSLAVDNHDRLMVIWLEKQSGSIFFSWANAAKASNPSEWADPTALPEVQPLVTSPLLTFSQTGKLYAVFAIPINEDRGIYLTTSADDGQTWTKPALVADAAAAGWEMVDQPQIAITGDSHLHVMWTVMNLIGDDIPLGIYYAHSEDDGKTWSQPVGMVESPVYWSGLSSDGDRTIHLVWQDKSFRGFGVKQQTSVDGGQTWSRASTIVDVGTSMAPASLSEGIGSQGSLILIAEEPATKWMLKQWVWKGDKWIDDASLELSADPTIKDASLNTAVFTQGKLGAIYSQQGPGKVEGVQDFQLYFTVRDIAPGSVPPTPSVTQALPPTATITPEAASAATPTPTQAATPVPALPTTPAATGRSRGEMILGIVMIFVVVGVAIGLATRIIIKRGTPV